MAHASLPPDVRKYSETPLFSEKTVPEKLTSRHNTKPGVWGRICVLAGELRYVIADEQGSAQVIRPGEFGIIQPDQEHFVELHGPVEFRVEFYR